MKTTRPVLTSPLRPKSFTSDRLFFRTIKDSDAGDYHAIRTDIELMKWTSSAKCDVDIEATRIWMSRFMPPNDKETITYSIEEKSCPGKVIGSIGVHDCHPPELGYIMAQSYWGKGYATEAARAFLVVYWALERVVVDVDDDDQEHERLRAYTDTDNTASRKVLEKCGFVFDSEGESEGRGYVLYYLQAPR